MKNTENAMSKYVIFDRDGTLIKHVHHLHKIDQIEIIEDAFESLKLLSTRDFKFGIISNQSIVGRGIATAEEVELINSKIRSEFAREEIFFDFVKFCPHVPDDLCDCRKPKTALGVTAISEFSIMSNQSFMVGDQPSDMEFARECGFKAVGVHNHLLSSNISDYYEYNLLDAAKKIIDVDRMAP